jgi:O-antigen biosynthesis protein WbqP
MKRLIDLLLGLMLLSLLVIPMILISIAMRLTSKGPIIYWSNRVGKDGVIFMMPKFRSMRVDAPMIPTHLMTEPGKYLFPVGSFLRRYSMDEFPQLFSIIKGEMSFVGPRPALFNQDDLIALRKENGVESILPGLTGLAQISGRDNLSIREKVALDVEYMKLQSFWFDFKILWKTFVRVIKSDGVSH